MQLHVFTGNEEASAFMSGWVIERTSVRRGYYGATGLDAFVYGKDLHGFCNEMKLLFTEDVSHAADLGADAAEFLFKVLVAAIEVVDAVEDGFAVGD